MREGGGEVFTPQEAITQIKNAIQYFILDKKPISEVIEQLKAVHEENTREAKIWKSKARG